MLIKKINIPNTEHFEELITVYETMFGKMVNARELHYALGVKKKFSDWIKTYIKNYEGYAYGQTTTHPANPTIYDYFTYEVSAQQGKGKSIEYIITLDVAKEIAMMSKCEKGHEIRKYFIKVDNAFKNMVATLQNNTLSNQEKIAEALLISNKILIEKDAEIKRANRNKEYNKKVNVRLRREIKQLKAMIEMSPASDNSEIKKALEEKEIQLKAKEEEVLFLEGSFETLEDKHTRLQARLEHLLKMKINGRSLLNAFSIIDIERRQRFVIGKAKEEAKIKAYKFRKDCILKAGITVEDIPGKPFVDTIHINDLEKSLVVYVASLKKLIGNDELFFELFEDQLKKADAFLKNNKFEEENNTLEENAC